MLDLDAIEAALAKMTPEPWGVADYTPDEIEVVCGRNGDLHVAFYNNNPKGRHDAAGIALLRNNADAMVEEIRRLRKLCGEAERKLDDAYCEPNWSGVEAVMHDLRAASKGEP